LGRAEIKGSVPAHYQEGRGKRGEKRKPNSSITVGVRKEKITQAIERRLRNSARETTKVLRGLRGATSLVPGACPPCRKKRVTKGARFFPLRKKSRNQRANGTALKKAGRSQSI